MNTTLTNSDALQNIAEDLINRTEHDPEIGVAMIQYALDEIAFALEAKQRKVQTQHEECYALINIRDEDGKEFDYHVSFDASRAEAPIRIRWQYPHPMDGSRLVRSSRLERRGSLLTLKMLCSEDIVDDFMRKFR